MRAQRGALALLLAGCGDSAAVPPATPLPVTLDVPAASFTPRDEDAALVETLRGLRSTSPLVVEHLPRAALIREAMLQFDVDTPASVLAVRGRFLAWLDLVPADFDLRAAILASLERDLVGLYDPKTKRVLVAADLRDHDVRMTRFHELAHALADQHFDLAPRVAFRAEASDALSASLALVEGDATSVMLDALEHTRGEPRAELAATFVGGLVNTDPSLGVPSVVARLLAASYVDGLAFVDELRRRGGWAAVDAAWEDPPETTEQILHLEKYVAREPALAVPIPEAPAAACTLLYSDTLGEQTLHVLLEELGGSGDALGGWGGDRLGVFECPDGGWARLDVHFDDAPSADAALRAFRRAFAVSSCAAAAGLRPRLAAARSLGSVPRGFRLTLSPIQRCDAQPPPADCSNCQEVARTPRDPSHPVSAIPPSDVSASARSPGVGTRFAYLFSATLANRSHVSPSLPRPARFESLDGLLDRAVGVDDGASGADACPGSCPRESRTRW